MRPLSSSTLILCVSQGGAVRRIPYSGPPISPDLTVQFDGLDLVVQPGERIDVWLEGRYVSAFASPPIEGARESNLAISTGSDQPAWSCTTTSVTRDSTGQVETDTYLYSTNITILSETPRNEIEASRVLDSRYLSHYKGAEPLNVPYKNEKGGLDWAPLLRQVGGGNSDAPLTTTVVDGIFYP